MANASVVDLYALPVSLRGTIIYRYLSFRRIVLTNTTLSSVTHRFLARQVKKKAFSSLALRFSSGGLAV